MLYRKKTDQRKNPLSNILADIFDTETAGLEGGVCDIAIVRINNNFEVVWEAESLCDPERPISPGAQEIHGISDEMVWAEPTLGEFMNAQGWPFSRDDLVVGGHNTQFDCRMLKDHMPALYRKVCTLRLARDIYPDAPDHKLQTLRDMLGLEGGTAHRAMGDVVTCINLLKAMAETTSMDLEGLVNLASRPMDGSTKMAFGKHKGVALRDLPASYVSWLLGTSGLDPDLRRALLARKS